MPDYGIPPGATGRSKFGYRRPIHRVRVYVAGVDALEYDLLETNEVEALRVARGLAANVAEELGAAWWSMETGDAVWNARGFCWEPSPEPDWQLRAESRS